MPFPNNSNDLRTVERMLLKEMDQDGRITVRSLDKIHARTGLQYATISELARQLQERSLPSLTA